MDVSNKDSIKNLATYVKEKYGGVDVLVNNAAILYEDVNTHTEILIKVFS